MTRVALISFVAAAAILAAAPAAHAEAKLYAYDPADASTRGRTGGVTLEVERGLLGGARIRRLFSTAARGSARVTRDDASQSLVLRALPAGATEQNVYVIELEGDGRALARALCPGSERAWFVVGRVRPLTPLTIRIVGQVGENTPVNCAPLSYRYRGEWDMPDRAGPGRDADRGR